MSASDSNTFSRRVAVGSAAFGIALVSTTRTLMAQSASPAATPANGEWTFTDDKGVTVSLPSQPENLVVDVNVAAPLWDFGIKVDALFGWNVLADGTLGDAGGNIDPEGIAIVGDVNQPIKVEETIAVDPDVIITLTWTPDDPAEYWSIDAELLPQVQEVAPLIGMSATGLADENTLRMAELAEALGADLASPDLIQAEVDFQAAITRFEDVAAAKSDLTVLFIAPIPESTYVANPGDWADLNMYVSRGLNIVEPDADAGTFWENISHEQALKYPADVVFYSTRNEAFAAEEITASPGWGSHPAVAAGQLFPWNQDFIQSYQGIAAALNSTADAIESASKLI